MAYMRYIVPFLAVAAWVPQPVQAIDMKYCASINTGTTPTNSSIYQSDGLCQNFCTTQSMAFAIVQSHDCWCSDFVPEKSTQVDVGQCNIHCPGFPDDTCGGPDLFGYIDLGRVPSGTAGGSTSATPTGQTSSSISTSSSSVQTTMSTSLISSTSTPSTSGSDPTDDGGSGPTTPTTPNTSVKTVTAGGTISLQTVTVTPVAGLGDSGSSSKDSSSSQALSTGATAGIAVGAIAGVAVIAFLAVFYHRRKKRQLEEELASRSQSHLSGSIGIMGTPTTPMASVWDAENTSSGRRSSRMMPHDPRMDPFATNIYGRFENKSRESINTLQDNQDYSRKVLRTTNPDPPEN